MSEKSRRFEKGEIIEICRARGLDIVDVEQRGTVLVVHPAEGAVTCGARALGQIAGEVDVPGVRYVTLSLDGLVEDEKGDQ